MGGGGGQEVISRTSSSPTLGILSDNFFTISKRYRIIQSFSAEIIIIIANLQQCWLLERENLLLRYRLSPSPTDVGMSQVYPY